MLILSRQEGESIVIHEDITITAHQVDGDQVKLAIDAPGYVPIWREEIAQDGPE